MVALTLMLALSGLGPLGSTAAWAAAPNATDQSFSMLENTYATVLLAVTDSDSRRLTFTLTTPPRHGTAILIGRRVRYAPTANYSGTDTFGYTVSDGTSSDTATVTVTVESNNTAPTTTSINASGSEDVPLSFILPATDPDGDALAYSIVASPSHGDVTIRGRTATYVGDVDWNGSDSFTFRASDSYSGSNVSTANITLSPVNDPPVAVDVTATCAEEGSVSVRLSATDVDSRTTLTYAVVTPPAHGSGILSGTSVTYRPITNFSGTDTFTYTSSDGTNTSAVATATITVTDAPDSPIAWSSQGAMPTNTDEEFPAEISDPDSASVTWVLDSNPSYGRVTVTATGFHYTPNLNYFGRDRWTWHANDGTTDSEIATFEVNVHPPPSLEGRPEMPQFGLNNIEFGLGADAGDLSTADPQFQPENIFADFEDLGLQIYRQLGRADLLWSTVELSEGNFTDAEAEDVIGNTQFENTLTLFATQYASPTPPWCTTPDDFQKFMTPDAYLYMDHIIANYADEVGYYEIGNEMYHWIAADPPVEHPENLPTCYPLDGYFPSEQAVFIEEASRYLKAGDPGAVVTIASVATDSPQALDWLRDVITAAGDTDWFDVVSYHAYNSWSRDYGTRDNFSETLRDLGIQDKLVRMTEYGSTSDPEFTQRTDYPNSDESQCADMFRKTVVSWGYGDATSIWHTYLPLAEDAEAEFKDFEIADFYGNRKPSAYAFRLLAHELVPFKSTTNYSDGGLYAYKVVSRDDETHWVIWGDGFTATIPDGMYEYTSVYPDADGTFDWLPCSPGEQIALTDTPILVR